MFGGPGGLGGWCGRTDRLVPADGRRTGRRVPGERGRRVRVGGGAITALCVVVVLALGASASVASARPGRRQIPRDTPVPVARGHASFRLSGANARPGA